MEDKYSWLLINCMATEINFSNMRNWPDSYFNFWQDGPRGGECMADSRF